jgi:hypothetical protein
MPRLSYAPGSRRRGWFAPLVWGWSASVVLLPTCDPRDFASQHAAKIHSGLADGKLVDSGPELELVALAMALVAVVTPDFYFVR